DMLSENEAQSPENLISVLKLHDELGEALHEIGDREQMILELRYGLTGKNPMTLEEVGKKLKLSRERIRQIEERALLRLRRVANRMGLIELSEPRSMGHTNIQPGWNAERPRFNVLGQQLPSANSGLRHNPFSNPAPLRKRPALKLLPSTIKPPKKGS